LVAQAANVGFPIHAERAAPGVESLSFYRREALQIDTEITAQRLELTIETSLIDRGLANRPGAAAHMFHQRLLDW
jgi:hypothetical protein